MSDFELHNYFRSSTSVRVRAALNLKGLSYDYIPLALLKGNMPVPLISRSIPPAWSRRWSHPKDRYRSPWRFSNG
ncbi:hypothetical protein [Sulfitobacter aestuariivivens]|uniref:hypothetical protein n=1 Tax=Sulfitobacter aestuariivivens TaxID=2766981 RepID=UPI003613CDCC